MFGSEFHKKVHFILCCNIALLLPFEQPTPAFICFLVLNWILEGDFSTKLIRLKAAGFLWFFIVFYLFHIAGLLWTSNLEAGLFEAQVKLSLLVFPLIFATRPLDGKSTDAVFKFFIAGCTLAGIFLLVRASVLTLFFNASYFLYVPFSYFLHPSYFSMYLNLAIIVLLVFKRERKIDLKFVVFLLPFFCFLIFLLSSKLGYLNLALTIVAWIVWLVIKQKNYLLGFFSLVFILSIFLTAIKLSPLMQGRLSDTLKTVTNLKEATAQGTESTLIRIFILKAAYEKTKEAPWIGHGTGSAQEKLIDQYKTDKLEIALAENLNAHNQFMQTLLNLGFVGLIALLITFFVPMIHALKQKNILYFSFIILVFLNFIPESLLERQAGTMFYGFFNSILFLTLIQKRQVTYPS